MNAIPHFTNGVSGRMFPTPFASPPGKGLSPAVVNVLWGSLNLAVAYLLVFRVGTFDFRRTQDALIVGIGGLLMAVMLSRAFAGIGRERPASSHGMWQHGTYFCCADSCGVCVAKVGYGRQHCEISATMQQVRWAIQMIAARGWEADGRIRRVFAVLGTALFLLLAPGVVVGLVPWWISRWHFHAPFLGFTPFRVIGALLLAAGIPVLLESFGRFALQGIGTPAPVFPTRHLVVKGFYRFVRNPMYVAVVSLILGQALLLGDIRILAYAMLAWLATHLFVLTYEEPTLRKSFGAEYETFCAHVPRWIPRFTAWCEGTE